MDPLRPIADRITSLELGHPTRVGVDGRSAAGKTTLADALAEVVQATTSRPVLRASIDDFHRPGHKFRSMREEWTPQSYYDESYDYLAFCDLLCDHSARVATTASAPPSLTPSMTCRYRNNGRSPRKAPS
jgi:uridine kinase